jgi:hypothetical protein
MSARFPRNNRFNASKPPEKNKELPTSNPLNILVSALDLCGAHSAFLSSYTPTLVMQIGGSQHLRNLNQAMWHSWLMIHSLWASSAPLFVTAEVPAI